MSKKSSKSSSKSSSNIKKKLVKPGFISQDNKYINYILLGAFLLLVFFAASYKITGDDDFFWHLATGRFIVENKYVPDKDIFGFVSYGEEWIPFEWGWDLITYGLNSIGGYNLILTFRSITFVFIFCFYYVLLRKFKVNRLLIIIFLFGLLIGIMDRLSPRPHVLTYVFFVTIMYLLLSFKYFEREKYIKKLYFLPLIFLLCGNIHMGVLAGGLFLFIFTVTETIIYFYPRNFSSSEIKPLTNDLIKKLWIISVLSALVLLLNPHGIQTYIYAYDHTKMKMLDTVNEWRSPFDEMYGTGFVIAIYKIFLFGGILILIYAYAKKDLFFALIYISLVIYSVRAIRFTVDYEIMIAFFLAVTTNYFIVGRKKSSFLKDNFEKITGNNITKIIFALFFLFITIKIPSGDIYYFLKYYRVFGWGVNSDFLPVQLFDFMKENDIKGTPFNHFGTGGYLVWNFPDQKNFIDSRNLNDNLFYEYNRILTMATGFEKKLDEYGIDYVIYLDPDLIRRPKELQGIIVNYLSRKSEWKLVFWDDKSFLFLKDIPKFSEVIKKYEYKVLNPYNFIFNKQAFDKLAKDNPEETRNELLRKSKEEPNGFLFQNISQNLIKVIPSLHQ